MTYVDNAATTPTPQRVQAALQTYYNECNANVHRSIHTKGEKATKEYNQAREQIATFINAKPTEIIFTKNTTESLNLVAHSLTQLHNGNIVLTEMEHHSNLVPWQQLAQQRGHDLDYIPVQNGRLDMEAAEHIIDDTTDVVSVVHASNFLGTVNPVEDLAELAHKHDAKVVVDAAQSVPHFPVDVKDLDCDFLAFSGHKMLGPTGVGVLYGKQDALEQLPPFLYGGDMIHKVEYDTTEFATSPIKFEAGTPPIAQVIGLGTATRVLQEHGMQQVHEHCRELALRSRNRLEQLNVEVYGHADIGLVSFNIPGVHPHDVGSYLSEEHEVAIRTGHHCVMPLHNDMELQASCRASFYIQNDTDDVEALIKAVQDCKEVFDV